MEPPRVAIVVPTIRDPDRLGRCLTAARQVAAEDGIDPQFVVVLDGAEDGVSESVAAHPHGATVLEWPERRGLAAALNAGFRATTCEYVAILQDDAVPERGWLAALLDAAARDPRAGAIGSLIVWPDGVVQSAGAIISGDGTTAEPWVAGDPPAADTFVELRAADYISSSSVLVRRDAWSAVEGFDEDLYPAIHVDADFCTALWHAGWLVLMEPRSVVRHARHGSTTKPFRDFVDTRNRARFMMKWGSFVAGRPTGPLDASAISAALDRANGWLVTLPVEPRPPSTPPEEASPLVHVARERDVLRSYVTALEERVGEVVWLHEEVRRRHEMIDWLHREVAQRDQLVEQLQTEAQAAHAALAARARPLWRRAAGRTRRWLRAHVARRRA
jgi:GT2 family glycosyltransferase